MADDPFVLYAAPVSLYSGKARAYLRKQGVPFVEVAPGGDRYLQQVVPKISRWIIPVLETPGGELVQDGAAIIRHFEHGPGQAHVRHPAFPETPVHRAISHVFELFGGEGLLRPAMHYRWNYDDVNLAFLQSEFAPLAPAPSPDEETPDFARMSGRMRKAAVNFGVTAETIPTIEATFHEWLDLFSAHLVDHPYLLGEYPTLGDYGLIAAMWAHLYRDPAPAMLIKQHAPRVGRWVERMTTGELFEPEYLPDPTTAPALIANDAVPDTLAAMMRYVADEYLAEITAHVEFANGWLAERPELETGTNGSTSVGSRGIGVAEFAWRGHDVSTVVMPYRFWLLQQLHDAAAELDATARGLVRVNLRDVGLESLLDLRTSRRVNRVDNLEVWGPPDGS